MIPLLPNKDPDISHVWTVPGNFTFRFLKPGKYALYALEDESGTHEYTTKAQIFAFADSPVDLTQNARLHSALCLRGYQQPVANKPKPLLNTPTEETKRR